MKETLRKVPNNGIGYGILRCVNIPEKDLELGYQPGTPDHYELSWRSLIPDIAKSTFPG